MKHEHMGFYNHYRINRFYYIQYHILSMVMDKGESTMNKETRKHHSEVTKDEWDRIHKRASKVQSQISADMLIMRRDWEQQPIIERLDKIIELLGGKAEPVVVGIVGKTEEPRTVCDHKEDMILVTKGDITMKRCEKCGLILNLIDYTLEFSEDTITQTKEYRCPHGHTTLKEESPIQRR